MTKEETPGRRQRGGETRARQKSVLDRLPAQARARSRSWTDFRRRRALVSPPRCSFPPSSAPSPAFPPLSPLCLPRLGASGRPPRRQFQRRPASCISLIFSLPHLSCLLRPPSGSRGPPLLTLPAPSSLSLTLYQCPSIFPLSSPSSSLCSPRPAPAPAATAAPAAQAAETMEMEKSILHSSPPLHQRAQ